MRASLRSWCCWVVARMRVPPLLLPSARWAASQLQWSNLSTPKSLSPTTTETCVILSSMSNQKSHQYCLSLPYYEIKTKQLASLYYQRWQKREKKKKRIKRSYLSNRRLSSSNFLEGCQHVACQQYGTFSLFGSGRYQQATRVVDKGEGIRSFGLSVVWIVSIIIWLVNFFSFDRILIENWSSTKSNC